MKTPEAIWPYSKAVFAWDLLFCSWQIPLNPETMQIVEWWIEEQTKQACENISDLLIKFWLKIENVVKTTIFLRNIGDFWIVNNIYGSYFITKPARSTIEVSNLPKWALLEIEVIAKK
jgi:2-iminobutanoate/2-iminopropanoate deaminase